MVWEDFGQRVDLTARLREILINYPEGTSILKELIQNADDARASCVRFCLDHRQHTTEGLLGPGMAAFQGPALLVFNDAVFSEKDFESISKIGDSVKREQAGKTGRFGIGFNSCYHLTDVPSFVSGSHLVIFDPHCKHLPNISSANPGKKINFVEALSRSAGGTLDSSSGAVALGQLAPYQGVYGCDLTRGAPWPRTLFRFPLRTQELAQQSSISKQAYDVSKVQALLKQLSVEANSILLFLKTIASIEISEWHEGASQPQPLFSCSVPNMTPQLAADRTLFVRASAAVFEAFRRNGESDTEASTSSLPAMSSVYSLEVAVTQFGAQQSTTTTKQYLISQCLGGGAVISLARDLSKQFTVPLIPWAAVAADVTGADPASSQGSVLEPLKGQAYCFLPLPAYTGLPVHVNAFFELSSNRRDIWHGEDMAGLGAARAAWNKTLLSDVAATAYTNLITKAVTSIGPGPGFYSLWPHHNVAAPWQALLRSLYVRLVALPVAYTRALGGRWLTPANCVLPDASCVERPELANALEVTGVPLAQVPPALSAMWAAHMPEPPPEVSPHWFRGHLRRMGPGQQGHSIHSPSMAAVLLDYCLSGVPLNNPPVVLQEVVGLHLVPLISGGVGTLQQVSQAAPLLVPSELELELLRDVVPAMLVDCALLHDETVSWLWGATQLRSLNVCTLDTKIMVGRVLPRLLRPSSSGKDAPPTAAVVEWGTPGSPITRRRVELLWRWLSQQDSLADFVNTLPLLPVLPAYPHPLLPPSQPAQSTQSEQPAAAGTPEDAPATADGGSQEQMAGWDQGQIVQLGSRPDTPVLLVEPGDLQALRSPQTLSATPEEPGGHAQQTQSVVLAAVPRLGVRVVDVLSFPSLPKAMLTQRHCQTLTGPGVLAALTAVGQGWGAREWTRVFAHVTPDMRHALRSHLVTPECLRGVVASSLTGSGAARTARSGSPLSTLSLLPIFTAAASGQVAAGQAEAALVGDNQGHAVPAVNFVNLEQPCFLQPPGFDASLLSYKYVTAGSPVEAQLVVDYLGVTQITLAEAYKTHVIPHLATLPPAARTTLTLHLLRALPSLLPSDPALLDVLVPLPLVPDNRGVLKAARELYDPREPDLAAMLDQDTNFPAAPFADDEGALAGLVLLGMRQQPGLDTLLEAAKHVQRCVEKAEAAAAASKGDHAATAAAGTGGHVAALSGQDVQEQSDMALARSKALLAYLEVEAARLTATLAFDRQQHHQRQQQHHPQHHRSAHHAHGQQHSGSGGGGGGGVSKKFGGLFSKVQELFSGGPGEGKSDNSGDRGTHSEADPQKEAQQQLQSFWTQMQAIRWCPVLPASELPPGLPLPSPSSSPSPPPVLIMAPQSVRPSPDMWLASVSLHILDGECRSSVLASGLGWSAPLSGHVLGTQLKQLGLTHPVHSGGEVSPSGPATGTETTSATAMHPDSAPDERVQELLAQRLAEVVPQLYRALSGLSRAELSVACSLLAGQPCVWVGSGFVPADKVAFQGSMDLSPWLYVLPAELSPFRALLKHLGVTDSFSVAQYIALLSDMRATFCAPGQTQGSPGTAEFPRGPLPAPQLAQAIAAVQALADAPNTGAGATGNSVIYVPDDKGYLVKAGELAYNDAPWMMAAGAPADGSGGSTVLGGVASMRLVHPKISNHVADRVGVASLRRLLLAQASDSVALGLVTGSGAGAAEAFGQSEALTTRLRHIIQDYPEGPGVLMELLQNADDAGAATFKLMLDARTHPSRSTLGPGMSALQGPAVLAYNDATFSPSDFSAIARIGQDAKLGRPAATGRFGLGFNAVYHLTDVPSFVSGDYVVLFDPHIKYVPGVNAAQPGLRIAFQRANLIAQFPDAFTPYTQFGCTLREPYAGTLFRFPLRTPTMASESDIKPGAACSPADVLSLFQAFHAHLPQALLFLKNVRQVEVLVLGPDMEAPQSLYSASCEPQPAGTTTTSNPTPAASSLQQPILRFLQEAGSSPGGLGKALAKCTPATLPKAMGVVDLVMRSTGSASAHAASVAQLPPAAGGLESDNPDADGTGSSEATLPGAAAVSELVIERQQWMVCNALGGGEAQSMAVQAAGKSGVKMIPWVGVAARVPAPKSKEASTQERDSSVDENLSPQTPAGRAYCFLPLPIRTGLPVHVNAFFELSSNRRDIWHGGDMSGAGAKRAAWNLALLRDGLAPAYLQALLELSAVLGPGPPLYSLFPPGKTSLKEPWTSLSDAFYQMLSAQPLIWVDSQGGRWLAPNQVVFVGDSLGSAPQFSSFPDLLSHLGLPVARHVPQWLERLILSETPGANALTPGLVRSHLAATVKRSGPAAADAFAQKLQQFDKQHGLVPDSLSGGHGSSDGTDGVHSAAVMLLEYCLSDLGVTPQTARQAAPQGGTRDSTPDTIRDALSALEGCPLLPLQSGALGCLSSSLSAPRSTSGGGSQATAQPPVYLLPVTTVEQQLLAGLPGVTLSQQLPQQLVAVLLKLANRGVVNVTSVTPASLNAHVLPQLLPAEWREQDLVFRSGTTTPSSQPAQPNTGSDNSNTTTTTTTSTTAATTGTHSLAEIPSLASSTSTPGRPPVTQAWLQLLWTFLAHLPEPNTITALSSWPVVPVQGGRLARIHTPSKVLRAGDWHDLLTSALTQLGCLLLDTDVLAPPSAAPAASAPVASAAITVSSSPLLTSPALQFVVQPPTLLGVLTALQATSQHATPGTAASSGTPGWPNLGPSEARQLRAFCLQPKWFAGASSEPVPPELMRVLFSLPVYEIFGDSGKPSAAASTATSSQTPSTDIATSTDSAVQHGDRSVPCADRSEGAVDGDLPLQKSSESHFSHLDQRVMFLAPSGVQAQLLTLGPVPCRQQGVRAGSAAEVLFLKCDVMGEARVLADYMGVRRMPMHDFLSSYLQPQVSLGRVPVEQVHELVLPLVRSLYGPGPVGTQPGAQERVQLRECLRNLAVFPVKTHASPAADTNAASHTQASSPKPPPVRKAAQLFDPRVPALKQLLDVDRFFPAAPYNSDGTVLDVLCDLGMKKTVTLEAGILRTRPNLVERHTRVVLSTRWPQVLVMAAEVLGADYAHHLTSHPEPHLWADTTALPAWSAPLLARSHALLNHLCNTAQVQGVNEGDGWSRLQSLTWAPVVITCPEEGLPWSSSGQPILAAPRVMRPPSDKWTVSSTLHILDTSQLTRTTGSIADTPSATAGGHTDIPGQLKEKLGWASLPRASVLCAQLMELGKMHAVVPRLSPASAANTSTIDAPAAPIQDTDATQPDTLGQDESFAGPEGEAASDVPAAPEQGSAQSSDDAPQSDPPSVPQPTGLTPTVLANLEAGLHTLYSALCDVCEGSQMDLVTMTFERGDRPCVWVGEGFVAPGKAVMYGGEQAAHFRPWLWTVHPGFMQYNRFFSLIGVSDHFSVSHFKSALSDMAATADGVPLSPGHDLMIALQLADALAETATRQGIPIGGGVMLPDAEGALYPSQDLYFNDADWLSTAGLVMSHQALPHATAEALGVRSLRYRQQHMDQGLGGGASRSAAASTETLPCFSPEQIGSVLGLQPQDAVTPGVVLTFLSDLLEVADLLGVMQIQVTLDLRRHPAQSLLHSGLGRYQGPALCVALPGVEVTPQELSDLLLGVTGAADGGHTGGTVTIRGQSVSHGLGLTGAFTITEVPQIISGSSTYMWDPSGRSLLRSAQEEAVAGGHKQRPRAQQYRHVAANLTSTFEDQYGSVWSWADTVNVRQHVNGTLIRLPLTPPTRPGAKVERYLGWDTASLSVVQEALDTWRAHAGRALLFCRKLRGLSIRTCPADVPVPPAAPSPTPSLTAAAPAATAPVPHATPGSTRPAHPHGTTGSPAVTVYQASLSWDPEKPRWLPGAPAESKQSKDHTTSSGSVGSSGSGSSEKTNIGKKLLSAAFGKVTAAAAGAVSGVAAAAAAAVSGVGDVTGVGRPSRQPPKQHETVLDLVTATQGQGAVHESWLVSSWLQEAPPANTTRAAAHASQGAGQQPSRDCAAAVAVCLGRSDEQGQQSLPATSGLHPILYPPPPTAPHSPPTQHQNASATGDAPGGSAMSSQGDAGTLGQLAVPAVAAGPVPPGATLAHQKFLVYGGFYWSKTAHGQRRIVPLVAQEAAGNPGTLDSPDGTLDTAVNTVSSSPAPGTPRGVGGGAHSLQHVQGGTQPARDGTATSRNAAGPLTVSAHVAARSAHNKRVVDGIAAAWLAATKWVLTNPRGAGAAGGVYGVAPVYLAMMPDLTRTAALGDALGKSCMSQMYHLAAFQPLWKLKLGGWATLKDGYFLDPSTTTTQSPQQPQPRSDDLTLLAEVVNGDSEATPAQAHITETAGGARLGSAAEGFLLRHMPILDVPYSIKSDLELVGISNVLQVVSPESVRSFLKQRSKDWVGRRLVAEGLPGQGTSTLDTPAGNLGSTWSLTLDELTQLLAYASADIWKPPSNRPPLPQSSLASHQISMSETGSSTTLNAPTFTGNPPSAPAAAPGSGGRSDLASMLDGLIPANMTDLVNTVNQGLNRAVDAVSTAIEAAAGPALSPAQQQQQQPTAAADTALPAGVSGRPLTAKAWNPTTVHQCCGLPVATAQGDVTPLGTGSASAAGGTTGRGLLHTTLLVVPPECGGREVLTLLPAQCHKLVLHPAVVSVLSGLGPSPPRPGSQPGVHAYGHPPTRTPLLQDPDARLLLGLRLFNFKDLARQLPQCVPPYWEQRNIEPPVSGWEITGATPVDVSETVNAMGAATFGGPGVAGGGRDSRLGPVVTGVAAAVQQGMGASRLGVEWSEDTPGPSVQWLAGVARFVSRLAEAAPAWGDANVRLSDLDSWPLLPLLPASGVDASHGPPPPRLLHVAYRALVTVLPPEFTAPGLATGAARTAQNPPGTTPAAGPGVADGVSRQDSWTEFQDAGDRLSHTQTSRQSAAGSAAADSVPAVRAGLSEGAPTLATLVSKAPSRAWAQVVGLLVSSGCPVLDPRFRDSFGPLCVPHVDLSGAVTVLIHKLRWTQEALGGAAGVAVGAPGLDFSQWSEDMREGLLVLLADQTPNSLSTEDAAFLKTLPIYPSLLGTRTSLTLTDLPDGAPAPTVCPLALFEPLTGLHDSLPEDVLRVLLQDRPALGRLYTKLGVSTLTMGQLLGKYVVPSMQLLPETVRAHVLTYILYHWTSLKSEDDLLSALKDCAFVAREKPTVPDSANQQSAAVAATDEVVEEELAKPGDLYDPSHALYGVVYQGTGRFPAGQFAFPAWLEVLRDVGLQHTVTTASFLEAARHVAGQGPVLLSGAAPHESTHRVLSAATTLMDFLGDHFHTLLGREFYEQLAEVPFVPACLGIPGGPSAKPKLVRYKEVAAPKDWPLCWTVMPIMAHGETSLTTSTTRASSSPWQVPASVAPYFRLRSPPPLSAVVQHLKNVGADGGESVLGSWPVAAPLSCEAAFDRILDHLHKEGLGPGQAAQLRDVAFLPVANVSRLVPPSHTFVRLKEDLAPLAYELPARYVPRLELLKLLGCRESPDAQWLLDMLSELARRSGGAPLNANQRLAVVRTLTALCNLATGGRGSTGGTPVQGTPTVSSIPHSARHKEDLAAIAAAKSKGQLWVLSADGRLCPPSAVVSVGLAGSRLLGRIDTQRLRFAHPQLPRHVVAWLGCAALQDTVDEVLDPSFEIQLVSSIGGLSQEATRQLLSSVHFIQAAWSCVQSHTQSVTGLREMSVQQVASVLRSLSSQLCFARALVTCVVLRSTGEDITRPGAQTSASSRVYDFKSTTLPPRHYVAEPPAGLPVEFLLSSVVSRALGAPLVLPLHPLFTCSPDQVPALQPVLLPGGWDSTLESASRAGEPGAPLHPSDQPLLQLRPLRRYPAGEVVAVQRSAVVTAAAEAGVSGSLLRGTAAPPAAAAAEAAARREAAASSDSGGTGGNGPGEELCYARVAADSAAAPGQPLHRVPLEVEPAVVVSVLSSQIYSFGSGTGTGSAEQAAVPTEAQVALGVHPLRQPAAAAAVVQPSAASGSAATTAAAAAGSAEQPAGAAPSGSAVVSGPVGAAQLVGAVRDLLGAAGLPLDLEQDELLSRAAQAQAQLDQSKRELQELRERVTTQQHELEAGRTGWQCKICYARDLDTSFTACGHMLCSQCATGMDRCPVCRKRSPTIRLFK